MEAREALLDRVSAAGGDTEIKDPATGEVIGRHTFGTAADVKAAVDKAVGIASVGDAIDLMRILSATPSTAPIGVAGVADRSRLMSLA